MRTSLAVMARRSQRSTIGVANLFGSAGWNRIADATSQSRCSLAVTRHEHSRAPVRRGQRACARGRVHRRAGQVQRRHRAQGGAAVLRAASRLPGEAAAPRGEPAGRQQGDRAGRWERARLLAQGVRAPAAPAPRRAVTTGCCSMQHRVLRAERIRSREGGAPQGRRAGSSGHALQDRRHVGAQVRRRAGGGGRLGGRASRRRFVPRRRAGGARGRRGARTDRARTAASQVFPARVLLRGHQRQLLRQRRPRPQLQLQPRPPTPPPPMPPPPLLPLPPQ